MPNPEEHFHAISHLKARIANQLDDLANLEAQLKHAMHKKNYYPNGLSNNLLGL
jgi:hypothetical protein